MKVTVPITLLTFVIGSLIPLLTALLTKTSASSTVKAVVNIILSIAAAVVNALIVAGGTLDLVSILTVAIAYYLTGNVVFRATWKPTGVAAVADRTTGEFGIG